MRLADFTYEIMIDMIKHDRQFAFSRWGDGEWACMLGDKGENCDGHKYSDWLGSELTAVLMSDPQYYTGMQPKATRDMGKRIQTFLANMNIKREWCNADILHDASKAGTLDILFDTLAKKHICLISSYDYNELAELPFKCANISVPAKNAWDSYLYTRNTLHDRVDAADEGTIFMFAAGMMSKVLIDDMDRKYGNKHTFMDAGSVLDPYAKGVATRRYHVDVIKRVGLRTNMDNKSMRSKPPTIMEKK